MADAQRAANVDQGNRTDLIVELGRHRRNDDPGEPDKRLLIHDRPLSVWRIWPPAFARRMPSGSSLRTPCNSSLEPLHERAEVRIEINEQWVSAMVQHDLTEEFQPEHEGSSFMLGQETARPNPLDQWEDVVMVGDVELQAGTSVMWLKADAIGMGHGLVTRYRLIVATDLIN